MLKVLNLRNLTGKIYIAVSGGSDSMAALHFLMSGGREVEVLHFNHMTDYGHRAECFVRNFCQMNNIKIHISRAKEMPQSSKESSWRDMRYEFFSNFVDAPIVTAHNLDDSIETWAMASFREGVCKTIPYSRNNVIRPFLLNRKSAMVDWCVRKAVPWIEDESNQSSDYTRNMVRNEMMPFILRINPGIDKLVRKKIIEACKEAGIE
jgi:tRNA(Ile)-lysidine synthase